jgi:hypothetical protein
VEHLHVAGEDAGADAQEGDLVAVAGVHVGLDLEDEAGEGGMVGGDEGRRTRRGGGGGVVEEGVEQELDAEVVDGAAEEDGGHVAGADGRASKVSPAASSMSISSRQGLERLGRHAVAD